MEKAFPHLSQWRERMTKQRKQYASEEKVAILRRHLLKKEPISKLYDEVGLQPTVFYRWQKDSSITGLLPSSRITAEPFR
jgi:hypothetical protein